MACRIHYGCPRFLTAHRIVQAGGPDYDLNRGQRWRPRTPGMALTGPQNREHGGRLWKQADDGRAVGAVGALQRERGEQGEADDDTGGHDDQVGRPRADARSKLRSGWGPLLAAGPAAGTTTTASGWGSCWPASCSVCW